jgi:hypothetical protein
MLLLRSFIVEKRPLAVGKERKGGRRLFAVGR